MLVQPYLLFGGRCEEALEFYRRGALGAEIATSTALHPLQRRSRSRWMSQPGTAAEIMHASFRVGGGKRSLLWHRTADAKVSPSSRASRSRSSCRTKVRLAGPSAPSTHWQKVVKSRCAMAQPPPFGNRNSARFGRSVRGQLDDLSSAQAVRFLSPTMGVEKMRSNKDDCHKMPARQKMPSPLSSLSPENLRATIGFDRIINMKISLRLAGCTVGFAAFALTGALAQEPAFSIQLVSTFDSQARGTRRGRRRLTIEATSSGSMWIRTLVSGARLHQIWRWEF